MLQLNNFDWIIIGLYLAVIVGITIWHSRSQGDASDFLLAGRKLTLPIFVGTLVSTWYGGILGISEGTGYYGMGIWLIQGGFWYVIYLIFALFLASRIRKLSFITIGDVLEWRYGPKVAFVGGIFTYIMVNPAPYLLSLAIVIKLLLPVSFLSAVLISAFVCIFYTMFAGFRGVVYTDFFQFICMYIAFAILFFMSMHSFGDFTFLEQNLKPTKLSWTGDMDLGYILVWAGLACWVFVDPNFYQRCFAAKDASVARKGILVSIVFWFIFDTLSIGSALYAFAASNAGLIQFEDGKLAYFALAQEVLPSPLKGLLIAGILSILMSTTDSFLFVAATNISRDYYWRYLNKDASDRQIIFMTRIAILVTISLTVLLVLYYKSVVELWYVIGTIGVGGLLIPMVHAFFGKQHSPWGALASMLSGGGVAFTWLLLGTVYQEVAGEPRYPLDLQPLYAGLIVSSVIYYLPPWPNKIAMRD